jgi:hypothetical protein
MNPSARRLLTLRLSTLVAALVPGFACFQPPIVDAAAPALDAEFKIIPVAEALSGIVVAIASFRENGVLVSLDGASSVSCNGVPLTSDPFGPSNLSAYVPGAAAGQNYTFALTRGSTTTTAAIPAQQVVITSPSANASVTRSTNVTITYTPGGGVNISGSAVGPVLGAGSMTVNAGNQPDTGTYSGLDVLNGSQAGPFQPGAGTVRLKRKFENTHTGGAGFHSVKSTYEVARGIPVTWM